MTHGLRAGLTIPRLLAVSALGIVGCPAGDDGDTGNETGPSMPTSRDGSTTAAEATTTGSTTRATGSTGPADSSGSGTETDTGTLPDCSVHEDRAACGSETSCSWQPDYGGCVLDCTIFEDEASCNAN